MKTAMSVTLLRITQQGEDYMEQKFGPASNISQVNLFGKPKYF